MVKEEIKIMTLDKQMIWEKIKDNKVVILAVILSLSLLISLYKNYTNYNNLDRYKKEQIIEKIEESNKINQEILKVIKHNIDSIHVEQKYIINKIDGTQSSIKVIEKQRDEKIKYIHRATDDSTVSLLRDRYSKLP